MKKSAIIDRERTATRKLLVVRGRSLKSIRAFVLLGLVVALQPLLATAQSIVEHRGLADVNATSLSIYNGIVAVGTEGNGVYWRFDVVNGDSAWNRVPLDSASIQTVYAHKSGPIGWAIAAGIARDLPVAEPARPLIFCSYVGQPFRPLGYGIDRTLTSRIVSMSGFPDPTICGETFAAGDRGLYRRFFSDSTWHSVFEATIEGNIEVVKARPELPGIVMAGGADGFAGHLLVRSDDFGATWKDISPIHAVSDVDFGGEDASTIFAATYAHIHRSNDGGMTWTPVVDADRESAFTHVIYDDASGYAFASLRRMGNRGGLLFSVDRGDSWHPLTLDSTGYIADLRFGGGNEWIYFVTPRDGLYRIHRQSIPVGLDDDATDSHVAPRDSASLLQNYPNPVLSSTTIPYTIPAPATVTIEVVDLLGRRVWRRTRRHEASGRYEVKLSADGLANGVYNCILRTGQTTKARRLIIAR